jgi:hypothetical protein
MSAFLARYPYFSACMLGLCFFAAIVYIYRSQRRAILISGLLAAPQALFALYLVPKYWDPVLVFDLPVGIEDILFMFLCGGMAWVEASWPFRRSLHVQFKAARIASGLAMAGIFAALLGVLLLKAGIQSMSIPLFIMAAWTIFLVLIRRTLWPLAVASALQSVLLYLCTLGFVKWLWPSFFSAWTWSGLSGVALWGIPVEEVAWGLAYGPFWGTTMAWLLDVSWEREPGQAADRGKGRLFPMGTG